MQFIFKTTVIAQTTETYKRLLEELSMNDYVTGTSWRKIKRKDYQNSLLIINLEKVDNMLNYYLNGTEIGLIIKEETKTNQLIKNYETININDLITKIDNQSIKIITNHIKEKIENKPEEITQNCEKKLIDAIIKDNIELTSAILNYQLTIDEFNKIKNAYNPTITIKKRFGKQETTILL